ncbi:hypothetical protein Droror1_Dr00001317 [Drosera rotundifolia]
MLTAAVAVSGRGDGDGSGSSKRAVRWAAEKLSPRPDRLLLVHVRPPITHIPTPSGGRVALRNLESWVVKMYLSDLKLKTDEDSISI